MLHLIVHFEATLMDSDNHTGNKMDPLMNGHILTPCWNTRLPIKKASSQHLPETLIVYLGAIIVNNLQGPDTPSSDLVLWRTVIQGILIPMKSSIGICSHLDLPLQHPSNHLEDISATTPYPPPE